VWLLEVPDVEALSFHFTMASGNSTGICPWYIDPDIGGHLVAGCPVVSAGWAFVLYWSVNGNEYHSRDKG
ncbi:MAG TPA: hypothetical protein PKN11_07570, partial [Anaerolineaceae bacterium]|nr:hypothetical protein [Anaerolineaceae bacterium]